MHIRGLALKWFRSYLSNQKQFVENAHRNEHSIEIKNYLFSEQYIKYGVPQASILRPKKFPTKKFPTKKLFDQKINFSNIFFI